jgi:hypothetical protein
VVAIAPEVAAEYASLTDGGAVAGRSTLERAQRNVAARQAASQAAATAARKHPAPASPGGRSATLGAAQTAYGAARRGYRAVGTPSAAAQTITRLVWAIALGLIALQVAAEATGQRWSFNLPAVGKGPAPKQPYVPLYSGQAVNAMPAVFGGTVPTSAPLSNRSSGNQAVG